MPARCQAPSRLLTQHSHPFGGLDSGLIYFQCSGTASSASSGPEALPLPVFLVSISNQLGEVAALYSFLCSSKCLLGYTLTRSERLLWALSRAGRLQGGFR